MQRKVLCVATWGDPRSWLYARYVAGDQEGAGARRDQQAAGQQGEVKAFSTLSILQSVEQPDEIVVVVLDTLASHGDMQRLRTFNEIEEEVRRYVKRYLCGVGAEIAVLPGVMELRAGGKRVVFRSDPRAEFLPILLHTLLERALRAGATDVVLDISHGLNFVPTLALKAAEEACAALAVARADQVRLRVYQSDPYPVGAAREKLARSSEDVCKPQSEPGEETPTLRFNLILERAFKPWDLSRYTLYGAGQKMVLLTDPRECGIEGGGEQSLVEEWALPLLGAFRLGTLLQLALLAKAAPAKSFESLVEKAIGCWKRKRGVSLEGDKAQVLSGTRLGPGFTALIHAHAVLKGVSSLLGLKQEQQPALEEAAAALGELKKLKDGILKGSRIVKALVDREISKLDWIEKTWRTCSNSEWTPYSEVQRRLLQESTPEGRSGDTFERDFIAHAGFHSEVVELRLANGRLEARVRSSEWGRVKEVLRKAVLEG